MKKSALKLFLLMEGLVGLAVLFQLVQDTDLLLVFLFGLIFIKFGAAKSERRQILGLVGWFMVGMSILSTFSVWLMLILLILFVVIHGKGIWSELKLDSYVDVPWEEKAFRTVKTREPGQRSGIRKRQKWIGNTSIGTDVYEWDDVNLTIFMGDTIIDLGNTLLPKEENIILIRKGFGKTRVIVPLGIGVSVHHSTIKGQLSFNEEEIDLTNEMVKLYSQGYDEANRKIKIVSNSLLGDLEVIYL